MHYSDPILIDDLETLAETEAFPSVSIYLPTARLSQQTDRDVIVLKNLRREAATQMSEAGVRNDEIEAILAPVDELIEDAGFWPRLSDGLAIFSNAEVSEVFRVPLRFDQRVSMGSRFTLKPLLPLLADGSSTFHILALSQNEVRLFEGTKFQISQIPVSELPSDMAEALSMRGRDPDRLPNKQWQGDEGTKNLYRKYFRQIDRVLRPILRDAGSPLILAGVDYLLPIYRDASSYRRIAEGEITGNPEIFSAEELHKKALEIAEPILDEPRQSALAKFRGALETGLASSDPAEILQAAAQGRVDSLLIDPSRDLFGTVDPDGSGAVFNESTEGGGESIELSGQAARWTIQNGGTLIHCDENDLPEGTVMGALFRF